MRSKIAAEPDSRSPAVRASHPSRCGEDARADFVDLAGSGELLRASRASSAERRRWWGHWLQGRLIDRCIATRTLADGYLGVDEKTARDVLTGRKALGPERLELLEDVAEDFIEEFARQTFGARAITVLARVMGKLAKEG